MKYFFRISFFAMILCSAIVLFFGSCVKEKSKSSEVKDAASVASCDGDDPEALRFSIIPHEESSQLLANFDPVVKALEKSTGKKIEFYVPTSYSSVIEAMVGGWVDISELGPNSYLIAKEQDPSLEVLVTYAKIKGHFQDEGPGYQAFLIAKKGSAFTDIASLKGSVLGLVDPASTSGNLVPRVTFAKQLPNNDLDAYFSKVVYTGQHDLSAVAVKDGKVDVAFAANSSLDNAVGRGLVAVDDFNVLWKSPVIPGDPFVVRGALCDSLKQTIKDTFLNFHKDPTSREYFKKAKMSKFIAITDADYDVVRELRAARKKAEQ